MSNQGFVESLINSQVAGAQVNTSVAATSILPGQALFTFPSNYFQVGKTIRIGARGAASANTTVPGTILFDIRGTSPANVLLAFGLANTVNLMPAGTGAWEFEAIMTCRASSNGTGANFMSIGSVTGAFVNGSVIAAGSSGQAMLPTTFAGVAVGAGFDATATQTLNMFITWSVSSALNNIICHQFWIESLN